MHDERRDQGQAALTPVTPPEPIFTDAGRPPGLGLTRLVATMLLAVVIALAARGDTGRSAAWADHSMRYAAERAFTTLAALNGFDLQEVADDLAGI